MTDCFSPPTVKSMDLDHSQHSSLAGFHAAFCSRQPNNLEKQSHLPIGCHIYENQVEQEQLVTSTF